MIQTVTVTGVDNNIDHPANPMATITHTVESDDTLYDSLRDGVGSVTVTATDDDTAGVTIAQSGTPPTTVVAENGGTDTYTVVLDTEPTDDVTVTLTSDPTGVVTISPDSLTFGDANWNTARTVTLRGINNNVIHADDPTTMISHAFSSSEDSVYDDISDVSITVTATDDDIDSDSDGTIDALDIDDDNDGLIEIHNLDMLDNIRNNLAGTTYDDEELDSGGDADTGSIIGAPTDETAPGYMCTDAATNNLCGYELMQNLDFATAAHYASEVVNIAWRPTTGIPPVLSTPEVATNAGFNGFGPRILNTGGFSAIFEGNGHSINNFYSRNTTGNGNHMGLFRFINSRRPLFVMLG